jgi:hypothetical protein
MMFNLKNQMPNARRLSRSVSSGKATCGCIALAIAVVFLAGCGGPRTYPASGRVTLADGTPLADTWVMFRSADTPDHVSARGLTESDGSFKLTTYETNDGAVPGKHQAILSYLIRESEVGVKSRPFNTKFSNYDTSMLEFTVTDDPKKNQFDIVVTK